MQRRLAAAALLVLAVALLACGDDDSPAPVPAGEGQPRPFAIGLSALSAEPRLQSFPPGASLSEQTKRLTRFEKELARENNLRLFLAIDPTEPGDRGRLVNLPDELRGRDFSDAGVRAAFIAYAKYLAFNYKPAYLALGVEVDMFYVRRGDGAFRNFVSLYFEAYDAAKAVSPDTLVFPVFQYEDMLGILNTGEATLPAWSLVNRFEPKIDMLAVTSFPGFVYTSANSLPPDYYEPLRGRSQRP